MNSEVCADGFQSDRGPDGRYRTSPVGELRTRTKGGFHHDGRFPTLLDVVNHYGSCFGSGLGDQDKADLVEFLKSSPARKSPRITGLEWRVGIQVAPPIQ